MELSFTANSLYLLGLEQYFARYYFQKIGSEHLVGIQETRRDDYNKFVSSGMIF
jgi:hypothetical protein